MNNTTRNILEKHGIDVDKALERMMGNDALFIEFLKQFTEDKNYSRLKNNIEKEDVRRSFDAAHTLKGLSANLELHPILEAVDPIVEELRKGSMGKTKQLVAKLDEAYEEMCEMIKIL